MWHISQIQPNCQLHIENYNNKFWKDTHKHLNIRGLSNACRHDIYFRMTPHQLWHAMSMHFLNQNFKRPVGCTVRRAKWYLFWVHLYLGNSNRSDCSNNYLMICPNSKGSYVNILSYRRTFTMYMSFAKHKC